jgi:uncharacterized protein (DUF58 family)
MRAAFSGLRGRIRLPRRLRVTFEGKGFLLLTLGVGAAAINTGNNLLYIALSMNLSLIILSGILSEWCIRGVSVRVRPASEAFVSRESLLAVTCSAAGKRFPAMSITVGIAFRGTRLTARIPEIPAGGEATRVLSFLPKRRGTLPPVSCEVSTRFPFALFEKSMDAPAETYLVVYPEPEGAGETTASRATPDPSGGASSAGRQGTAIRGAREHMPADAVRDIHWKASARMGKWMVKERDRETAPVADLRLPVPCPPFEFEQRVSRACAFVLRCEKEGLPYRLWIGDRLGVDASGGRRRYQALTFLAQVDADGTLPGEGGKS